MQKEKSKGRTVWDKLIKDLYKKIKQSEVKYFKFFKNSHHAEGLFYSKKSNKELIYRSSYEFAFMYILEHDDNVIKFVSEPFEINYKFRGKNRRYHPDLLVLYKNGSIKLYEIKPKKFIKLAKTKTKALAARKFLSHNMPNASFDFITEFDIFGSEQNQKLLKDFVYA